jgi:hypothetical protein
LAMEWKPVENFPGYSVNRLGQVRRDSSGRLLQVKLTQYGSAYIGMMREWRQCQRSLALLVANHFLPGSTEIFDTPINLNGDRYNCAVDNLMWRPRWFARKYHQQFKHPYSMAINSPIRCRETNEVFPNSLMAAVRYGLLERDVVLSIANNTVTLFTYQRFVIVE